MGLDAQGTEFILRAYDGGLRFGRVATMGRQGLHQTVPQLEELQKKMAERGFPNEDWREWVCGTGGMCEGFLKRLGASEVVSFDKSGYEGATNIVDLNEPLQDSELVEGFDTAIDGGTLEHVFNALEAWNTACRMVKVGGHLIAITPANNQCGHGFYQFSPEFFFALLHETRGWTIQVAEYFHAGAFHKLENPAEAGERLESLSALGGPLYLYFIAKKTAAGSNAPFPQQSDYSRMWRDYEMKIA